jgi:hypothetical protein
MIFPTPFGVSFFTRTCKFHSGILSQPTEGKTGCMVLPLFSNARGKAIREERAYVQTKESDQVMDTS